MSERKYAQCAWCGTTMDVTNTCDDLCKKCAIYETKTKMIKGRKLYYEAELVKL